LWFAQAADSHELLVFRFQLLRKKPRGMIEFSKLVKIELCVFGFGIPIAERERERERTSAVEFDGALQSDNGGGVGLGEGMVELLKGLVVVGDVGLVVLLVVELHDLSADHRLQSPVVVGQVRQREALQSTNMPKPQSLGFSAHNS
jgi:hypothetical protein